MQWVYTDYLEWKNNMKKKMLTISQIKKDSFKFVRGGKEIEVFKWIVWFAERKGFWADSVIKDWNVMWHVGQAVMIYDSQWTKRTYVNKAGENKEAWTIAPPPQIYREEFDLLVERIDRLENKFIDAPVKKEVKIDDFKDIPEEPETDEEKINEALAEIKPEEIPF